MSIQAGHSPTQIRQVEIEHVRIRVLPDGRMTRRDAAAYLGVTEKTMAMWALQGKGPPIARVGGRCHYFKEKLDAFIRGQAAD